MKQVLIRGGGAVVEDVPAPAVGARAVLVQVSHSCVSAGTEGAAVAMSNLPLYRRALKQPHHVKRALQMMADTGVRRTVALIKGRLDAGLPAGYSAVGEVIAVGAEVEAFKVGDWVGCAGAGIANHAEVIDVPVNLAAPVPPGLKPELASTVTLGAIAMQGVRRLAPTLGETFVVMGLGILGQITAQLLRVAGCVVVGTDVDPRRIEIAGRKGMPYGSVSEAGVAERIVQLTGGRGADGVIVTAATPDSGLIGEAFRACRRKGRVVLVGDVGLNIDRNDIYAKELDLLVSTSYGPGRYDPLYEDEGHDYPLAYVRWTENRNMEEYLRLLSTGAVDLEGLATEIYPVDQAAKAYGRLQAPDKPLLILLQYEKRAQAQRQTVTIRAATAQPGKIGVGLAGAGQFALGVHLPNLAAVGDPFELKAVMSRTGATAMMAAKRFSAAAATTDFDDLLKEPAVGLVLIATRHDLHTDLALRALAGGKNVLVEKPLATTEAQLDEIEAFFRDNPVTPVLMTGFNRRFSPAIAAIKARLAGRRSPLIMNYVMNAGFIPGDHWVHGPQGGGRNIGEACHVYDLFNWLTGSEFVSVEAAAIKPVSSTWRRDDNFVATISYADGSICSLTYTALGDKSYPKERSEIFVDGQVITLDDYKSVKLSSQRRPLWSSWSQQKGHEEELRALAATLTQGGPWPISLNEQIQATRISFEVERLLGMNTSRGAG